MNHSFLGQTGISVSKVAFGTLTLGPLQRNFSAEKGADLLVYAFNKGINFFDTAHLYETYPIFKEALKTIPRDQMIISTKSYAYDRQTAEETFHQACELIGTDYIDLFMLHEQESIHTIRGHFEALSYFKELKNQGHLRAVGLSTHRIDGVEAAIAYRDYIDVIHPIINKEGVGIQDGTPSQMIAAINRYHQTGGGVFAMKAFGGGHLLSQRVESLEFVLNLSCIDSVAIGMQTYDEIDANVLQVIGQSIPSQLESRLKHQKRNLVIDPWCTGCGTCINRCQFNALELIDGKASVISSKCVTCGYCGSVCPDFCIKII